MVLLDTHIWLWWINGTPGKLPGHLIERIENADSVAVSAISCFEIEWLAGHSQRFGGTQGFTCVIHSPM